MANIWRAGHFPCCTYVSIVMDLLRWHFGTLDSANGPQDLPNMNKIHTFDFLHVDWYWWKETWEARWIHYDYCRAPRSHKYKYIYICISQCDPYIYEISVAHLSFLYRYLPCDEMFLKYSWALKHNIKNVGVPLIPFIDLCGCGRLIVLGSPGGRTPNPRVPKSQKMQTSSRWRHIPGDICTTNKNNWQPIFHRLSQCVNSFFWLLHFVHAALAQGAPAMVTISPYCFQGIIWPISMHLSNREAIWWKVLSFIVKPHHWVDLFISSEKINTRYQFSCMGHSVNKM